MITQTKVNKLLRKCYELQSNMRRINVLIDVAETKAERLKERQQVVMQKMNALADDIKAIDPLN